jgi:hypothetical protein
MRSWRLSINNCPLFPVDSRAGFENLVFVLLTDLKFRPFMCEECNNFMYWNSQQNLSSECSVGSYLYSTTTDCMKLILTDLQLFPDVAHCRKISM